MGGKGRLSRTLCLIAALLLVLPSIAPVLAVSTSPPSAPRQVFVGTYLNSVSEFNVGTGTYSVDFYLWFRWAGNWTQGNVNGTVAQLIAQARAIPAAPGGLGGSEAKLAPYALPVHFDLANGQINALTLIAAQPDYNSSGYNFLQYRVRATMQSAVSLQNYPLDVQTLSVVVEDQFYANSTFVYVPDQGSQLDPSVTVSNAIPGWVVDPGSFETHVTNHNYDTQFGYQVAGAGNESQGSSDFILSMTVHRPFLASVTQLLLPIAMIIGLAIAALFISPQDFGERTHTQVIVVLAAVVLQVAFSVGIPATGQFSLADRSMLVVYGVLSWTIATSVVHRLIDKTRHAVLAIWLDRVAITVVPLAAAIIIGLLFWSVCGNRVC